MGLSRTVDTLVIGAGPTGLGAACRLDASGEGGWLIVDAATGPGGMAVTEVDSEGFRWDFGGHVIHSHYRSFDQALTRHSDWTSPKRGGWVRVADKWCPTPIQRNLGSLAAGPQIVQELSERAEVDMSQVNDLGSYYNATFGATLNQLFFAPFNRKQWGWPLDELSHTWTSLRSGSKAQNVPAPNITSALTAQPTPEDVTPFPYPTLGTGSLWQSIAGTLPQRSQLYNTAIDRIDLQAQIAHLSTGESIHFKRCLSTMPLASLLNVVDHERPDLSMLQGKLRYTSTFIVGFGFTGILPSILEGKTWIFAADTSVPFHRATILTNISKTLSGPGRWSIMFETSISEKRHVHLDSLVDTLLAELRSWGIDNQPISVWKRHLKYGYPLPFRGRDELLEKILPVFEKHNVFPRGRFGGWRYESSNQDYAFAQGAEAARFFQTGQTETAYWTDRPSPPEYKPMLPLCSSKDPSVDLLPNASRQPSAVAMSYPHSLAPTMTANRVVAMAGSL